MSYRGKFDSLGLLMQENYFWLQKTGADNSPVGTGLLLVIIS